MVQRSPQTEEIHRTTIERDNYLPTAAQRPCLVNAPTDFQNFGSLSKYSQTRRLILRDAQFILDTVFDDILEMGKYSSTDFTSVHN